MQAVRKTRMLDGKSFGSVCGSSDIGLFAASVSSFACDADSL